MAGAGGIFFASRLRSVATNTGGGNLLLLVIAAAVIGGTSLFGGVGRVATALYGALVIASPRALRPGRRHEGQRAPRASSRS